MGHMVCWEFKLCCKILLLMKVADYGLSFMWKAVE